MIRKGLLFIYTLLFFLNFSAIKAQSLQKEKQPLIDILKVLETKYNISFSFADTKTGAINIAPKIIRGIKNNILFIVLIIGLHKPLGKRFIL